VKVRELLTALTAMVEGGQVRPDDEVLSEGCDCIDTARSVRVGRDPGYVVVSRDSDAVQQPPRRMLPREHKTRFFTSTPSRQAAGGRR
jgi:hypothetical protein